MDCTKCGCCPNYVLCQVSLCELDSLTSQIHDFAMLHAFFFTLQEYEVQVTKEMRQVTEYFGEGYDATDPAKVLRVIKDFMTLFDKSIFEIKVGGLRPQ